MRTTCFAALALAAAPATAAAPDTAEGLCTATGTITFHEPIGNEPRRASFTDAAEARCTGTVNGQPGEDELVLLRAEGSGTMGCTATSSVDHGVMTFTRNTADPADDVEIDYIAESTGGLTQLVSRVRGAVSGEVLAHVNFLPYGSQEQLEQCAAGTLRSVRYDMEGQTLSPLAG